MVAPLDGPRAKVVAAEKHIGELSFQGQRFFGRNVGGAVIGERDRQTGLYRLNPPYELSFPNEWSVMVGEIAYDLRSALDQLVCQLAIAKDDSRGHLLCEANRTSFPVFLHGPRSVAPARSRFMRKNLSYLKPQHISALQRFQPFVRGNGGALSPLWLLHQLNNTDKHNIVVLVGPYVLEPAALPAGTGPWREFHAKRAPRAPTWLTDPLPDVPLYQIAFGDRCAAAEGLPAIRTLTIMAQRVSTIIESFAAEFP